MFLHIRRFALICTILLNLCILLQGGITSYTERGKADFDTVMQTLNPYGTWSKIDGLWAYTPLDHQPPYTHGRWIYTEYGWYWKGSHPHGWVTEHYGYWKRDANRVWSWYPGPYWLPEIVEIRATSTHIGWRSAAVDSEGNFVEKPEDRYAKVDEWCFVTLAQFAGPITPDMAAKPEVAAGLLDNSTESRHTYVTYREIDRPGPHPADFLALCKDGGMFAPKTLEDKLAAQAVSPHEPVTNAPPVTVRPMTGTNAPTLMGAVAPEQATTARKVKYWLTMSLPTFWTPPPPEAKPEEVYLYRPDFYQDEDGIARRIQLWLNPGSRKSTAQSLSEVLAGDPTLKPDKAPKAASALPATPAVPVAPDAPAKPHDPFRSPFDDSFDPNRAPRSSSSSSKAPAAPVPPPPDAPAEPTSPSATTNTAPTNAAPAGRR